MLRKCIKLTTYCAIFPASIKEFFDADVLTKQTPTEQKIDASSIKLETETGWERVKRIFEKTEFGGLSTELSTIVQVTCMSSFVGALYGGILNSRTAYIDFMRDNQATAFTDHIEAKKRLHDKVTISFAKGALKWSWRLTAFSTCFIGISTVISVYRGKTSVLDFVAAGTMSGFLYKFKMGPRAWLVGGGLGGLLGLVAGGSTMALLSLSGMTMEEARYWQNKWHQNRSEYFRKGLQEHLEKEEFEIIVEHNKMVGNIGPTLDNLDNKNA